MVNVIPTVIYSCMLGMVLLALLDVVSRLNNRRNLYFNGLLLLLLVHLVGELFIYSGAFVHAPSLAGAQLPFRVLLGPAFYFYVRATISNQNPFDKRLTLLALSGPVLVIVAMLPFIVLLTAAEKLALANPATRDPELWKIAVSTCLFSTTIFISYTALFLAMALKLHSSFKQQLLERFSEIEQRSFDWLRTVLLIWGFVWLMYAIEFSLSALGWFWFGSGVFIPALEAIALALFIQKAMSQKELTESEKATPESKKPRSAILDSARMELIATKLERAMTEEKLFLQDNLSLNLLSDSISETENHISETFSQHLNTNFFQYVNGYRIEAAKKELLKSNKLVTSIALDVGFNSKSTFNTAFKKMVGHSPSAYRKLHTANNQQAA